MYFLAPLLEVQDLDLAADAARTRSAKLPERQAIPLLVAEFEEIDSRLAAANAARAEKQTSLEERELEFLEEIEAIENRIEEQDSARAANRAESARVVEAIRKVEGEVLAELGRLAEAREKIVGSIPTDLL